MEAADPIIYPVADTNIVPEAYPYVVIDPYMYIEPLPCSAPYPYADAD